MLSSLSSSCRLIIRSFDIEIVFPIISNYCLLSIVIGCSFTRYMVMMVRCDKTQII